MKVAVFRSIATAGTISELRDYLQFRDRRGFGSFWLWHETGSEMGVMINRNDAYIHFFPGGGHPGFQPIHSGGANPEELVDFVADNNEPTPMPRRNVLTVEQAQAAVDEFFQTGSLPSSIEWFEF